MGQPKTGQRNHLVDHGSQDKDLGSLQVFVILVETETIWIVLPATIYSFQNFEHVDLQTVALTGQTYKLIYQDSSCLVKPYNRASTYSFLELVGFLLRKANTVYLADLLPS